MAKSISEGIPRVAQRPRKPRTWWRWGIRLVIVLLFVGGFGLALVAFQGFKTQMISGFIAKMAPPPAPVAAVAAKLETMPRYLSGIGTLTGAKQVTIAPEVAGRVTQIMFEPGASVKAGDPLVQFYDAPDRADLANFQAAQRLAEVNLGRARSLAEKEFGSKQAQDQAQMALDQAKAGIGRTSAVISQKLIKAPFDGVLGIRQINLGQYLNPGTAVVTLTDLDTLFADFTLPEQNSGQIAIGQGVEVTSDAFAGKVFAGKISTIEPQVDPQTRSIKIEATIPNADHALRPGMFAQVRVVLAPQTNVVTIPETAVDFSAYGSSVFIIKADGNNDQGQPKYKAVQAFVTVGEHRDGRVAIEKGLAGGDLVATSGQIKLINGAPVRLSDSGELQQPAKPPRD